MPEDAELINGLVAITMRPEDVASAVSPVSAGRGGADRRKSSARPSTRASGFGWRSNVQRGTTARRKSSPRPPRRSRRLPSAQVRRSHDSQVCHRHNRGGPAIRPVAPSPAPGARGVGPRVEAMSADAFVIARVTTRSCSRGRFDKSKRVSHVIAARTDVRE